MKKTAFIDASIALTEQPPFADVLLRSLLNKNAHKAAQLTADGFPTDCQWAVAHLRLHYIHSRALWQVTTTHDPQSQDLLKTLE